MSETGPFAIRDRSFLVTGAASGIGREVTAQLLHAGNRVIAVDRDGDGLATLAGEGLTRLTVDLCAADAVKTVVAGVDAPLHGVVNCAGIIRLVPVKAIRQRGLREIDENNYEAPLLLTAGLLKKRKVAPGASIVLVSSIMSVISTQTNALYTGTKAALAGVTRTLALELAPERIRVNAVSPAFVQTPMMDYIAQFADLDRNRRDHPLGFGEPADVAGAIFFLLSDASRWITGSNLILDGGYCAA